MHRTGAKKPSATAIIGKALGLAEKAVPADARIGAFEPWDSLGHMRIILELENALGRELGTTEAVQIESVADIDVALELPPK